MTKEFKGIRVNRQYYEPNIHDGIASRNHKAEGRTYAAILSETTGIKVSYSDFDKGRFCFTWREDEMRHWDTKSKNFYVTEEDIASGDAQWMIANDYTRF